jgi:hypothetical protein
MPVVSDEVRPILGHMPFPQPELFMAHKMPERLFTRRHNFKLGY